MLGLSMLERLNGRQISVDDLVVEWVRWTRLSDECLFQAILPFAPAEEGERGKEGRRGKSRDRQIVINNNTNYEVQHTSLSVSAKATSNQKSRVIT